MAKMNKVMNPEQMSKVTQQFVQEHTKLGLTDEMSTCERIVLCTGGDRRWIFQSMKRWRRRWRRRAIRTKKTPLSIKSSTRLAFR